MRDRIALAFAALFIHDCDRTLTVHHHQVASLGLYGLQVDEAHCAVALGVEAGLFRHSRCCTSDVEGTHGELRSRFATGLSRHYSRSLPAVHHAPCTPTASRAPAATSPPPLARDN